MENNDNDKEKDKSASELLYLILQVLRQILQALTKRITPMPADFPYYSSHEIMRIFDISDRTMLRWCEDNTLLPIRIHNRTFFKKSDIIDMLEFVASMHPQPGDRWLKLCAAAATLNICQ